MQMLTDLEEEVNNDTTIEGKLNTPLPALDRSSRQKNNLESLEKPYFRWDEPNKYIENFPSNSSKIYTFL